MLKVRHRILLLTIAFSFGFAPPAAAEDVRAGECCGGCVWCDAFYHDCTEFCELMGGNCEEECLEGLNDCLCD